MPASASIQSGVLDPQGPIAAAERVILWNATAIMLAVIIPVILLTLGFAWWFRAGNRKAKYLPDFTYSGAIEVVVWAIPVLIVLFLGGIAWIGSHDLDPRRPLQGKASALPVQVVSLDWKWLFIYPTLGVASVNELVVPSGAPLSLQLTSGSVMNSFFVPQLGSQIYTMARMTTQLQLLADHPGVYPGFSAQFSGAGFSDMRFNVRALNNEQFNQWLSQTRKGGQALDAAAYAQLTKPGLIATPRTYAVVTADMFDNAVSGTAAPLATAFCTTRPAASAAAHLMVQR